MTVVEDIAPILNQLQGFYGPNAGYALELYERYLADPASVDPTTRAFFESLPTPKPTPPSSKPESGYATQKIVAAVSLAQGIRTRGHLGAHLDPLGSPPLGDPALLPETYDISEAELAELPPEIIGGHAAENVNNALAAIQRLRDMYSGTISYQFDQVKSPEERRWLRDAVGLAKFQHPTQTASAKSLLRRLTQVEGFERYLHQNFAGQKRFSLEGTDVLVPMLDEIIAGAVTTGTQEVIIGMAHRGRLNVLTHVIGKPYAAILAEFSHTDHPEGDSEAERGWSGDVKYHLGYDKVLLESGLKISLSPNPSHLEYVNPVIQGMTRASQENRDGSGLPTQNVDHTLPVVIHGDAAFPGEGIVAETLNLWHLRGYTVGGTIHIIANNQIGFTTEPEDGRSTHFASDLAKGFEIPIIHVNADDPEAALTAARMAKGYRDTFHKDILVDLIGYRRWGHNEGDEPAFTQPRMYEVIRSHPTVRQLFAEKLEKLELLTSDETAQIQQENLATLEQAKQVATSGQPPEEHNEGDDFSVITSNPPNLSSAQLQELNQDLLEWPSGFNPNPKLARLLQKRANLESEIDWGHAESLAFASILADGTAIRLTGQDAERGTFSHRHAVLHDQQSGETFTPLQNLPKSQASFAIYNSPISEAAVLGFEYGYSVRASDSLVVWEAQFGDFANVAQVIIDQFISSGRAKWRQKSSLVLLLPHGYEGQGPEHSSARIERYLALSAAENWQVANCSTSAQYFHLLRRQAADLKHNPRALVIFTPKSLLRNPLAAATQRDLTEGTFQPVINDTEALKRAAQVKRLVLCSGKISIELLSNARRAEAEQVAIARVEQLYPFPAGELSQVMAGYPNLQEVVWVQEEPQNMGAWRYMIPRLNELVGRAYDIKVVARHERSSPATGFLERFQLEQEQLIQGAFGLPVKELGGVHGS